MKLPLAILLSVFGSLCHAQSSKSLSASSPSKNTRVEYSVMEGKLRYRLFYNNAEILKWSPLGLITGNGTEDKESTTAITGKTSASSNSSFKWSLGEDEQISNIYNELTFDYANIRLVTRVYDGSLAFKYILTAAAQAIRKEETAFQFSEACTIYQYNHESAFTPKSIDTFTNSCDLPATLTNGKWYVSIGEANNHAYTKTELKRGNQPHSLSVVFPRDSVVKISGRFESPWRTISVSNTAIGLHDYSQLYLKLNPPPVGGIPDWIRPGKLVRAQLNTQSALDCISFAAKNNFQYIMFDAGWYGAEFRGTSDPTQVIPEIDMPKVIAYGKEKGIGLILYVNYVGLKAKLDTILPLYKKWGVAGLKFGFVDGLTQSGLSWLSDAIRKVNEAGFILDVHDNYKPTGLSRTYPALLTQEGIRGDENSPDAFHNTTLPFTRFLAGPADFTFCYPNEKNQYTKNIKVSMAQQLALTVVYFSPLQAIFWYGQPNDYTNEGEIEFFKLVPTVWNESHYLAGEIGKGISVARRNGSAWFLGSAAGLQDWHTNVSLSFLNKGKNYVATIYEDDGAGSIRKRSMNVNSTTKLPVNLKGKEGQAIIIK